MMCASAAAVGHTAGMLKACEVPLKSINQAVDRYVSRCSQVPTTAARSRARSTQRRP